MPSQITSLQNDRVKNAVKLRDRRGRKKQGRIIIDGCREISRALSASVEVVEIFTCEKLASPHSQEIVEQAVSAGAELLETTPAVFAKLAFGDRAEAVVAIAKEPRITLADLKLPKNSLVAVLEAVEKPGNLGAILRSADAAGVSALISADSVVDLYNPNIIRASLGAVFTTAVCSASSQETIRWLREQGLSVFATRVDGAVCYSDVSLSGPVAIVLGSEAQGLSDLWNGEDITAIHLPIHGQVDSLNVSATAAVLFYEAIRQRRGQ